MKRYQIILITASLFFFLGFSSHHIFKKDPIESLSLTKSSILKKKQKTTLQSIIQKQRSDVIILNSPTVYYEGPYKTQGFGYELIASYAKSIGVDLNLSVVHTIQEALELSKK